MMQLHNFEGGKIWLDTSASEMQALMAETRWEWRKADYMRQHLKPGMTFVDVGAYNGYFALLAAKLVGETGQVFAFEPEPSHYEWLLSNIGRNGYSNIMPYRIALSDRRGSYPLFKGTHDGNWSLYRANMEQAFAMVRVRPLDHVLEDHPFERPLDMVKIDVEGAEADVLKGAIITIAKSSDLRILMDLHPDLGIKPGRVEDRLLSNGFKLFDIRSEFEPIPHIPDSLVELLAVQ